MEKYFDWRDLVDFKQCQRVNVSVYGISDGFQCRKGVEVSIEDISKELTGHPLLSKLDRANRERVEKSLVTFHQALVDAEYQEDAMADWVSAQKYMMDQYMSTDAAEARGSAYSSKQVADGIENQLERANNIMINKMPTHLDSGTGTFTEASLGMRPAIGLKQLKWEDPILGGKYGSSQYTKEQGIKRTQKEIAKAEKAGDKSAVMAHKAKLAALSKLPDGASISVKNNVAPSKFSQWQEGNATRMLEYKKSQEAQGKPWPTPATQPFTRKEVDDLIKANPNMWQSGLNIANRARGRDDGFEVYESGSKNPSAAALAARESKNRAIAEAYLAQGGKSPITGQDIKVPKSNAPSTKTVVDHIESYRSFVKPGLSIQEISAAANSRSNFMIVEGDLNDSKGERSWGKTAANLSDSSPTSSIRRSVTDNWNDSGSTIKMSRVQFERTFGNQLDFESPAVRQSIASAYEQKRVARIFRESPSSVVPTARNRNSRAINQGFTNPNGASVPAPKITSATSQPKPRSKATSTRTPKATRAPGLTQAQRTAAKEAREATKRGKAEAKEVAKSQKTLDKLQAAVEKGRAKRDRLKSGSTAYKKANEAVSALLTLQRRTKREMGLLD